MKYKLNGQRNPNYNTIEQILVNRGIKFEDIHHYLNTTDGDINDYSSFGSDNLSYSATLLIEAITKNKQIFMPVDPDCDGYCSCAIFLNYLYKIYPEFVKNNISC